MEVGHVSRTKTLDDVLFYSSSSCDDRMYELVLDEKEDHFSEAGGDQIGCEAQKDVAFDLGASRL